MKTLVIGADSVIGSELYRALRERGDTVQGTTRRSTARERNTIFMDLAQPNLDARSLPRVDVAIFCAAIAGFAACRQDSDLARRINVTAPAALANSLVDAGAHVILLSTSAVFDWTTPHVRADCIPCPVTVYGTLKAEAESEFLKMGNAASVIRFSKVLTPQFKLFLRWIEALRGGENITAFSDMCMSPIGLADATSAIQSVIDDGSGGIFQLSGSRDISYYEAALHIGRRLGFSAKRVLGISAIDAGIPSEEITYFSSLDDSRLRSISGRAAPDPFDVIDAVFGSAINAPTTKAS